MQSLKLGMSEENMEVVHIHAYPLSLDQYGNSDRIIDDPPVVAPT